MTFERFQFQYPGQLESVHWCFWDHERYQGGQLMTPGRENYQVHFFNKLKRTLRQSNMYVQGQLPNPQGMIVQGLAIRGVTRKVSKGAVAELIIGSKIMLMYPLDEFNRHRHHITLSRPVFIAPQTLFCVRFSWDSTRYAGGYQPKMEVQLIGELVRPVQ